MELDFVRWLRDRIPAHPLLAIGPGDDAAVLRTAGRADLVVTTDQIADGTDFRLPDDSPRRVGHKALAINLSDLAAMAARPLAAVIAVNLPRRGGQALGRDLLEGIVSLAERYQVALAGGDTNSWDGPLVISVTALGEVTLDGPLCRRGAQPGDRIIVTGSFGGSILGRHLDVEPRVDEALLLNQRYRLRAGIDCSDGLSLDLSRVCAESHCGAIVDSRCVPIAAAAQALAAQSNDGISPLDHALSDGEDFELILAVPPESAGRMLADQPFDVPLTDIGQFVRDPGLRLVDAAGKEHPLEPRGFEHAID